MSTRRALVQVGSLLLAVACNHSGPATSSTVATPAPESIPTGTMLSFVSGEDDRPVSGASVVVSGQSTTGPFTTTYTTDTTGRFALDRPMLLLPLPLVDIVAPGFVSRNTLVRSAADTRFSLWPSSSPTGLDEDTSATLVYSSGTCPAQNTGTASMRRVNSSVRQIFVGFGPGLQDQATEQAHRTAIDRLSSALGGAVSYSFTNAGTGVGVLFPIQIDPADPTCTAGPELNRAATYVTVANGEVIGGRLVYCNLNSARDLRLVMHELGHTYGLYHSASARDVMYCTAGRPTEYSAREALVMALMRQRRAGNRWPDNDRSSSAPARVRETVVFDCSG